MEKTDSGFELDGPLLVQNLIIKLSPEGIINYMSNSARELFDYAGSLIGKKLSDTLDPTFGVEGGITSSLIKNVRLGEDVSVLIERSYSPPGKTLFWIQWHCTYLFDENRKLIEILCLGSNITERKTSEAENLISSTRFSALFNNNPSLMTLTELETGIYVEANNSFCQVFGWKREELIGKNANDINLYVNPEDREQLIRLLHQRKKISNVEVDVKNKSGETMTHLLSCEIVRIADKSYMLTSALNITERKTLTKNIFISESNLRSLFNTIDDLIMIVTPDGRIAKINKIVSEKLEYIEDEIRDRDFLKLIDRSKSDLAHEMMQAAKTGQPLTENLAFVSSTGKILLFDTTIKKCMWSNQEMMVFIGRDITEKLAIMEKVRESRTNLKAIIETSPDSIALFNQSYELISFNAVYSKLVYETNGMLPRRGMHFKQLNSGTWLNVWGEETKMKSAPESVDKEVPISLLSGDIRYYQYIFQPVLKEEELIGHSLFIRDITERKLAALKVAESEKLLFEAQRIARVGHVSKNYTTGKVTVSPFVFELVGTPYQENLNSLVELFKFVHPDDLDFIIKYREEIIETNPERFQAQFRIINSMNELKFVEAIGSLEKHPESGDLVLAITLQDISERKDFEIELKCSHEEALRAHQQLRAVFDALPGVIVVLDDEKKVVDLNSHAYQLLNLPEYKSVTGRAYNELFGAFSAICNSNTLDAMYQTGKGQSFVFEQNTGEFSGKSFKLNLSPIFDNDHKVWGAVKIMMDITDLKKAETALLESETRLKLAIEGAQEGLWDLDLENNNLYVNEMWCRMLDYDPLVFKPSYQDWIDLIHPDDKELTQLELQNHLEGKTEFFQIEFRMLSRSGVYKWLHAGGKVVNRDSSGKALRMIGTHTDITLRKEQEKLLLESENRLKLALEGANEGLWDWDVVDDKMFYSQSWSDLIGFESSKIENSLQWWLKQIHLDDLALFKKALELHLATKTQNFKAEFRMLTRQGEWRWMMAHGKTVDFNKSGKAVRIIGTMVDITERKEIIRNLEKAEKELRELVNTKDKLFSIIAHDLKNPFNLMIGFSDLLTDNFEEYDKETIQKFLKIINNASLQGNQLLENLLQWSRSQTGRLQVNYAKVSCSEAASSSFKFLKNNAESKSVSLDLDIPENIFVWGDLNLIETVIRNLVSNAIKFSLSDQKVSLQIVEKSDFVEFLVVDKGVGMAKEVVEKLFLSGLGQTSLGTNNEKGTGLGLILCKELVEKMGGTIQAQSKLGFGSKFTFTIPAYKGQE